MIRLAFEFNGHQHYIFPNQFHKNTPESFIQFEDQQRCDNNKLLLCKDKINDILLIEFPYYIDEKMNHPQKIQDFIIKEFKKRSGITLHVLPQFDYRDRNTKQKNTNQLRLDDFKSSVK